MSVAAPPRPPPSGPDPEALIAEARRRARRRRLAAGLTLLALAGVAAAAYALAGGRAGGSGSPGGSGAGARGGAIRLERPGALAVAPSGGVYVADDGREQILERLPDDTLRVVAGTGKAGFSGDGGPAAKAELNGPAGMALARDGTLFFADQGNNRIRAVAPDGTIRTVAGNGRGGWAKTGTKALAAPILSPAGLTFDRKGRLVIADGGWSSVLRLEPDGTLTRLAGVRRYAGVYGVGGPATKASAGGPVGLAYDRGGDLFLAGFNTKTLLMISPQGRMEEVGADYPYAGGMVATPDGRVLATNRSEILELTPHGPKVFLDFLRRRFAEIPGFDAEGIAADAAGNLYLDTWPSGYTNGRVTALVELRRDGTTRALWRSR
jgi:DNA-binding beta-propeller fold protein YncE